MDHVLEVRPDADALVRLAGAWLGERARSAVDERGGFTLAVSGGRTPWALFRLLALTDAVPWDRTTVYQVDERIAPDGHPDRNLTHLLDALGGAPARVVPMPVGDPDPAAAADRYAELLPERLDVVHLGLGPDGHTASLVPGDPVLDVVDRPVAPTGGQYQGRRRLTLTYPGLARARDLVWLVTGAEKAAALAALLAGDAGVPAARVVAGASLVLADRAAAGV